MNKDDAREAARSGFTLPGEEPLDKVAFDCGYKAGAASVDRRAIVEAAFERLMDYSSGVSGIPFESFEDVRRSMDAVIAEMGGDDEH